MAGDGERFGSTWVLGERAPADRCVTAVGFYGERLRVGHGCHAGWSSFGPERRITRSEGNVLYELDGKPALALYKNYLGERAAGLPATALLFPLAIRRDGDDGEPLVRTILGVDEAAQSLTFAGDMPQGHRARLMRTNTDQLIQSAGLAGARAAQEFPDGGTPLALAVSCVGRRLVLGERTEEEIESVLDALPRGAGQVGFYSYGEMSPRIGGGALRPAQPDDDRHAARRGLKRHRSADCIRCWRASSHASASARRRAPSPEQWDKLLERVSAAPTRKPTRTATCSSARRTSRRRRWRSSTARSRPKKRSSNRA